MKNKIVSAADAIAIIRDGDTVASSGFVGSGTPDELINALEARFVATGAPRDLTLVFAAAPGDGKDKGLNRLAHGGLIKRVIGGHWSLVPKLGALAVGNRIEAYNLPLGTLTQLFRDIAGHRAGTLTKVGLRTFVDPRGYANPHRHLSHSRPANHLRRATLRRHEPTADGRIHLVLLRVPLPVHQWH